MSRNWSAPHPDPAGPPPGLRWLAALMLVLTVLVSVGAVVLAVLFR